MLAMALIKAAAGGPIFTLSGESIAAVDGSAPYNATTAAIRVNTDGTIDKGTSTDGAAISYSQIDSATDWIIPNSAASATYECRITSLTGDAMTSGAAVNTWVALSINREWTLVHADVAGTDSNSFTLELRYGSGATLTSGSYSLSVENTA